VAKRIGVDEITIYNWENNQSFPPLGFIPKIIEFLGYVPFENRAKTLGEKIVYCRRLLGLNPRKVGKKQKQTSKPITAKA